MRYEASGRGPSGHIEQAQREDLESTLAYAGTNLSWPVQITSLDTGANLSPSELLGPNHKVVAELLDRGVERMGRLSNRALDRLYTVIDDADWFEGASEWAYRSVQSSFPGDNTALVSAVAEATMKPGPTELSIDLRNGQHVQAIASWLMPSEVSHDPVMVGCFEDSADGLLRELLEAGVGAMWAADQMDDDTYAFYTEPIRLAVGSLPGDADRPGFEQARTPIKIFFSELVAEVNRTVDPPPMGHFFFGV